MTALDRNRESGRIAPYVSCVQAPVEAAAAIIYEHALVRRTTAGGVVKVGDALGTGPVVGVALSRRDNSTGAFGDTSIDIAKGLFARPNSTGPNAVTWAHFQQAIYAADDQTFSSNPAHVYAGTMYGFTEEGEVIAFIGSEGGSSSGSGSLAFITAPLDAATEADGTPLAAWVDGVGATPGYDSGGGEFKNVRWNPNAAPDPIALSFALPLDLDADQDVYVYLLAAKAAAGGDLPTFTVGAYFQTVGTDYDADANAGGVTNAMTDTAKQVQLLVRAIAAANVPASTATSPALLNLTLGPTAGTLPADDVLLGAVFVAYSTK